MNTMRRRYAIAAVTMALWALNALIEGVALHDDAQVVLAAIGVVSGVVACIDALWGLE